MKAIKYLVAGLLVMGLAAPAMAQDVNYKDALKPIETTLKAQCRCQGICQDPQRVAEGV